MKVKKSRWTTKIGLGLAALGLLLIVIFSLFSTFNDWSWRLNTKLANEYGGFIGGLVGPIFSLAGFILLYETIIAQKESFDKQQEIFRIQQFETKFFELIKFHRDNVSQMSIRLPWELNSHYDHAKVFIEMRSQFLKLYKIIKPLVEKSTFISSQEKVKAIINISYLILFFGISKTSRRDLIHFLTKYGYSKNLTAPIIIEIYKKRTKYNPKTVYFGGHQVRLGHYFRNLFQTVKFVDQSNFLNKDQKYEYIKTLRSQLTQHELGIFFLNSLSIGQEWEKNCYVTRYQLIKNLPQSFFPDINPKFFYSGVAYEWEK